MAGEANQKKGTLNLKPGRPSVTPTSKADALKAVLSDVKKVRVNFDIDESLHTQLKILAAKERRTIAELLRELIEKRVA